jgi:hypothetical protein
MCPEVHAGSVSKRGNSQSSYERATVKDKEALELVLLIDRDKLEEVTRQMDLVTEAREKCLQAVHRYGSLLKRAGLTDEAIKLEMVEIIKQAGNPWSAEIKGCVVQIDGQETQFPAEEAAVT